MAERRFERGEPIVMRHVRGDWRWAAPMHVVEDRGDFVALYLQPGSGYASMGDANGQPTRDFVNEHTPIRLTWRENHALHLVRFGDEHATVLYWREGTWEFRCWYINFQEPLRRYSGASKAWTSRSTCSSRRTARAGSGKTRTSSSISVSRAAGTPTNSSHT